MAVCSFEAERHPFWTYSGEADMSQLADGRPGQDAAEGDFWHEVENLGMRLDGFQVSMTLVTTPLYLKVWFAPVTG